MNLVPPPLRPNGGSEDSAEKPNLVPDSKRKLIRSKSGKYMTDEEARNLQKGWSVARKRMFAVLNSTQFDCVLAVLISANLALVVLETNATASEEGDVPDWIRFSSFAVTLFYVLELIAGLYVYRLAFFFNKLHVVDFVVIVSDFTVSLTKFFTPLTRFPVGVLRILRAVKMLRLARVVAMFPELHMMARGLVYAFKAILAGCCMLAVVLTIWSILAVLFIHPINVELTAEGFWDGIDCERCPRAFQSVQESILTFIQTGVVGDKWAEVQVPIVERYPATGVFFFFPAHITLSLAVMNLILALIVEKASVAREDSIALKVKQKEEEFEANSSRLYEIFQELDEDASGHLSFDEILEGYRNHAEFGDILRVMDIQEKDLEVLFNVFDYDGTGEITYKEFVEQLYMMTKLESHTLLIFIKFYVMEIKRQLALQAKEEIAAEEAAEAAASEHSLKAAREQVNSPCSVHHALPASPTNGQHALWIDPPPDQVALASPANGQRVVLADTVEHVDLEYDDQHGVDSMELVRPAFSQKASLSSSASMLAKKSPRRPHAGPSAQLVELREEMREMMRSLIHRIDLQHDLLASSIYSGGFGGHALANGSGKFPDKRPAPGLGPRRCTISSSPPPPVPAVPPDPGAGPFSRPSAASTRPHHHSDPSTWRG